MARYLIPLIAFLLAFGIALLLLGFTTSTPARSVLNPTPSAPVAATSTKITQLDISNIGYDPTQPNKAVVMIDVQATGTAPVTVLVTFNGTLQNLTQTQGQQPDRFSLFGKTKYVVTDSAFVNQYCSFNTRLVTAEVAVMAWADTSPSAVSSASGNLFSKQCS